MDCLQYMVKTVRSRNVDTLLQFHFEDLTEYKYACLFRFVINWGL